MNKEQLRQEENSKKKEVLFFDAAKEVEFLKRVDEDRKYLALGQELKTAVQELFFIQGGAFDRVLEGGRIKEPSTNTFLDKFVTDGSLDMVAFNKIQNGLNNGGKLVVHFSPQNVELDYPANVVDFWINKEDDEKIKFLRFFVDDNLEKMKLVYKAFGGKEEIKSSSDLLVNPLVTDDFRMTDVMRNLTVSDKKIETTKDRIDEVVEEMMDNFYENFGNEIFSKENLIDRIYSGVVDVVLKGGTVDEVKIKSYLNKKIDIYMYAPILEMQVRNLSGACPGIVRTAEFGGGKPMMVTTEGGSLVFKEVDNTDGLKECKACGFWYSGEKCPLCN